MWLRRRHPSPSERKLGCNDKIEMALRRYEAYEMTARELIGEIRLILYEEAHHAALHEDVHREPPA